MRWPVTSLSLIGVTLLVTTLGAMAETSSSPPLRIVTFGTSLTAAGGWQNALGAALGRCLQRPVEIINRAKSGKSSRWGLAQVQPVIDARPDIVLIEFSVNDAALHNYMTLADSNDRHAEIIRTIRNGAPSARIILMTMNPVWGVKHRFLRARLDSFYEEYRQLAGQLGVEFADMRPSWLRLPPAAIRTSIPDGLHPIPEAATGIIVPGLTRFLAPGCDT